MIGSFLTRGLVMVFGYAYPAYECFKSVEKNKPDIEQLRFWCQYWILVAVLTVCERIGDTFISWVPMYSEAKLAFYIYLWYPKTKGTVYVYDSFFRPYISKHETEIDRSLAELRIKAGDAVVLYWKRAASHVQTRTFDILQYVASQSTPKPQPSKPQQPARTRQPVVKKKVQTAAHVEETKEPSSPAATSSSSSSASSDSGSDEIYQSDAGSSVLADSGDLKTTKKVVEKSSESEKMQTEEGGSDTSNTKEIIMEEEQPVRVTRARLRKATSSVK